MTIAGGTRSDFLLSQWLPQRVIEFQDNPSTIPVLPRPIPVLPQHNSSTTPGQVPVLRPSTHSSAIPTLLPVLPP